MKKLIIAAIATSVFATPAFAANNNSANATITTNVPLVCEVTAPTGGTVVVSGSTPIGSATAICNDFEGFNATVSSANQGKMIGADGNNTSNVPYTLDIAGVANGVSLASPQSFPGPAYLTTQSFAFTVNTSGTNGPAYADTYSDVITIAIQNN